MFVFLAAGAWLVIALLVYAVVFFPFTFTLKSPRWRLLLLVLLAGLLGPGGAGGHGFLPLPSAVGLWMHIDRDPLAAIWHAGAWAMTSLLLWFWDKRLLRWFGKQANGVSRWLKRFLLGPFCWAPLQFLLANMVLFFGDLFSLRVSSESALVFSAVALLAWYASCYFLGARAHDHAKDYFVSLSLIGVAFLLFIAVESGLGHWQVWLALGVVAVFFWFSAAVYWWGKKRASVNSKSVALPH